ncbi:hypothetical protein [Candidatus Nanopusillus massiliensis]|uniref:hypothetical protein n=1 Tax=Candidatus Nanopusillus massiliensis TaxID=2897163 RepID=UPI001E352DBE|nr:hypothetical protein [Candidatus Nanopusillus massiliensis]
MKNKKLYSINLNNEKYIFDENKEIIIKIKDNEYYVYPENIEIKEEDINYLEILNNNEEIKIDFNINELYNLIKDYIELKNNEMFLRPETAQGTYVNFPK